MDIKTLLSSLSVTNKIITLDASTIGGNVWKDLLFVYNGNQPFNIRLKDGESPSLTPKGDQIRIEGTASFQLVPNLSVLAFLSVDPKGSPQARLYFNLIGDTPDANAWKFSQSFLKLPTAKDSAFALPVDAKPSAILDDLWLRNASFVLTTEDFVEDTTKIQFYTGLNFTSTLRPKGALGIFDSVIQGDAKETTISGRIIIPKETDLTPKLPPWTYAWDLQVPPPGILLEADLGVDTQITGTLNLKDTKFLIYSPHSTDWQKKNQTYQSTAALTGTLDIPSANISCKITAILIPGTQSVIVEGDFQGVSLGSLANLADISGTDSLTSNLPIDLSKAGELLKDFALESISLGFESSLGNGGLNFVSMKTGFPGKTWKSVPGVIEFSDFSILFIISNPFKSTRSISSIIEAEMDFCGVTLDVTTYMPNFSIRAEMEGEANLPLSKVFHEHFPDLPSPPDLSIDRFILGAEPGKSYSIYAVLGEEKPWVLDLGPTSMTISDVEVDITKKIGGNATGSFSGIIDFADKVELQVRYDIPGQFMIRSEIDSIRLGQLIQRLCDQIIDIPSGFDITLKQSSILISKYNNDLTFMFATQVDSFGSFAFQARKVSGGKWGYAVGMDLSSGKASSLPSLGDLSIFEDFFKLQKLMLVVSSFDSVDFEFPDMAQFQNPRIASKKINLPAQSGGLVAGFNFFGEWSLDPGDKQQGLLSALLGIKGVLGVTLQVASGIQGITRLYVSYRTNILGHPLDCKFGGQKQGTSIGLFLNGTLTVDIQGHPQKFDLVLLFVTNGAFISASMKGNTSVDFYVFKLSNLALEVGINWEGIPSLGVAATIDVESIESSVAVFFDSTNPSKSLVAGSMSDLSLKTILDTLTGDTVPSEIDDILDNVKLKGTGEFGISSQLSDALDNLQVAEVSNAFHTEGKISIPSDSSQVLLVVNTKGSIWYLTDLTTMKHYQLRKSGNSISVSIQAQFYCAPQNTFIGNIQFPAGFFVNGAIEFFGFEASVTATLNPNQGIAVDAQMDKLVIGGEKIFSISAAQGEGGPKISISTFSQPEQKDEMFRSPHFYVNGAVYLLGLKRTMYVKVTKSGLLFDIESDLLPGISFDLHGSIGGQSALDVGGDINVGLGSIDLGVLGEVSIDTGVNAELDLNVGSQISARIGAGFEFLGSSHTIASFDLDTSSEPLLKLADILKDKVEDILKSIFTDPTKWLDGISKGLIDGVLDPEKVLTGHFNLALDQAKNMMQIAGLLVKACPITTATSLL
ncbi:hypothetical protein ACQV5M_16690 [Leptospira sp. SA-E8]|uniref:hypothetical protein n=1 Tax=Leptospira sp. SA-E8 TaxID=3422259 RepID=UPI003EBF854F